MCKQNKQTTIQQFFSPISFSAAHSWQYHDTCVRCCWRRTRKHCSLFTSRGMHTHASWYSPELTLKIDEEEKKWLNKVIIFVFFAHKKYSRSFIKLRLNHWCHMDYFNDVLTTFLGLECVSCVAVYGGSGSSRISSKISSFVFWRCYMKVGN